MSTSRSFRSVLAVVLAAVVGSLPASAGQVRVNVSNFVFTPRTVNINTGDHVVWGWTGGAHSVTAGDSTDIPSGLFDSNEMTSSTSSPNSFSYRTSALGTILYYCVPHVPDMGGAIVVNLEDYGRERSEPRAQQRRDAGARR